MTTAPAEQAVDTRGLPAGPGVPQARDVLRAQFRAIGLALRVPMLAAVLLGTAATITIAIQIASGDMNAGFLTEPSGLPGIIGALLPVAVWAREERFGPGFLWTLPVDRRQHALLRTFAGWLWLMIGVLLYALAWVVLATLSGEGVLPVRTLPVVTVPVHHADPLDPAALQMLAWSPGPTLWLVPFAAATATYLISSAFMLGVRRPLRWVIVAVLAVPVTSVFTHVTGRVLGMPWLSDAPARAVAGLVEGRYGLEALLTLRTWSLDNRMTLTTGERIHVWSAVPDLGDWGIAAILWTGAGLLALWFAASRHRERRRA